MIASPLETDVWHELERFVEDIADRQLLDLGVELGAMAADPDPLQQAYLKELAFLKAETENLLARRQEQQNQGGGGGGGCGGGGGGCGG